MLVSNLLSANSFIEMYPVHLDFNLESELYSEINEKDCAVEANVLVNLWYHNFTLKSLWHIEKTDFWSQFTLSPRGSFFHQEKQQRKIEWVRYQEQANNLQVLMTSKARLRVQFHSYNIKAFSFIMLSPIPLSQLPIVRLKEMKVMGRPLERTVSSFTFSNLGINCIFSYGLDFVLLETEKKNHKYFLSNFKKLSMIGSFLNFWVKRIQVIVVLEKPVVYE